MNWEFYKNCLEKAGIEFERGLSDSEINQLEVKFDFKFPPDLKEFLQFALPTGNGFINWRKDSDEEIKSRLNWVYDGICFDIEHNKFWLNNWGDEPESLKEACEIARIEIEKAPKLIPVCSHRFIPDRPHEKGNPIFSVHQTDIIVYGASLPNYLQNEFSYYFPDKIKDETGDFKVKDIECWSELIEFDRTVLRRP